jgi:hypothetical protein
VARARLNAPNACSARRSPSNAPSWLIKPMASAKPLTKYWPSVVADSFLQRQDGDGADGARRRSRGRADSGMAFMTGMSKRYPARVNVSMYAAALAFSRSARLPEFHQRGVNTPLEVHETDIRPERAPD